MKTKRIKFKLGEAIVFEPKWAKEGKLSANLASYPLYYGEVVYFIAYIPNIPRHCIVARYKGNVVSMLHPEDFRKAKEEDL